MNTHGCNPLPDLHLEHLTRIVSVRNPMLTLFKFLDSFHQFLLLNLNSLIKLCTLHSDSQFLNQQNKQDNPPPPLSTSNRLDLSHYSTNFSGSAKEVLIVKTSFSNSTILEFDYILVKQQQVVMQFLKVTPCTVDNSKIWKLWHGVNIFIAGWTFLFGSLVMFPRFTEYIYAALCGWFFTIGSACFLLADLTQWFYFLEQDFRYLVYVINFFINVTGSVLYLVGSIMFIPETSNFYMGVHLFIVGAFFVTFSQVWKLTRTLHQPNKTLLQCLKAQYMTVILDSLAVFGALMYFIGSFVFEKSIGNAEFTTIGALLFCLGAAGNCISSIMIFYLYFFAKKQPEKEELMSEIKSTISSHNL